MTIPTEPIGSTPRPLRLTADLGTTDDCSFSPFSDDIMTTCDTAFAKIRSRVLGTALAAAKLGAENGT